MIDKEARNSLRARSEKERIHEMVLEAMKKGKTHVSVAVYPELSEGIKMFLEAEEGYSVEIKPLGKNYALVITWEGRIPTAEDMRRMNPSFGEMKKERDEKTKLLISKITEKITSANNNGDLSITIQLCNTPEQVLSQVKNTFSRQGYMVEIESRDVDSLFDSFGLQQITLSWDEGV